MQIGSDCFRDEQLKSMVQSNKKTGDCNILHKSNCIVYDTEQDDYLVEYFEEIFDVFVAANSVEVKGSNDKSDYLRSFLDKWDLFTVGEDDIQIIIKSICAERYDNQPELFEEKVTIQEWLSEDIMKQKCILMNNSWDAFCKSIKHVNRFHSHFFNFEQFDILLENMVVDFRINNPKGVLKLYRSRICDESHYFTGYPTLEMGAPPDYLVSAGRTNSEGIRCLYLSSDVITTFHEVRARDNDHVSVGEFIQKKDLKIVDLSYFDRIGPFSGIRDMIWFCLNIEIIRKIGIEVAKPMRRFDKSLDYIPTQYICDYIKYLGYDGIIFNSTLSSDGVNYAIFDERNFECNNVTVAEIKDIEYRYQYLT